MKSKLIAVLAATSVLALGACSSDNTEMTPETTMATTVAPATTDTTAPETTAAAAALGSVVEVAAASGSFSTLIAAIQVSGLAGTLSEGGPFTVFAPSEEAFAALPAGLLEKLLKPENKAVLAQILTYHVVSGKVLSSDVKDGAAASVEGSELTFSTTGGIMVNDAKITTPDVPASNGVIHVIDKVLLPAGIDIAAL
jgi:uncharacterized surface protein with fasciclin (FAS1) repeats